MSQSGKIFGALLLGFLVYVTLLGHLPEYFKLLWGKAAPVSPPVDPKKGSGAGVVAPNSSLPGYEGVPTTPFFYGPNPNAPSPYA